MYNYASHYYGNAALSRPQDSRMWSAMSGCYEKMRKLRDATKCLERAQQLKDSEGIALFKLAKLYVAMNEVEKAVVCFEENLSKKDEDKIDDYEFLETHMYLAKFYSQVNKDKAKDHCKRLIDFGGYEGEKAKHMLEELNK